MIFNKSKQVISAYITGNRKRAKKIPSALTHLRSKFTFLYNGITNSVINHAITTAPKYWLVAYILSSDDANVAQICTVSPSK